MNLLQEEKKDFSRRSAMAFPMPNVSTDYSCGAALSDSEQHQLLVEWNATEAQYPQTLCVQQLFEAQVERTPEAVALVFQEHQLTYRELNERANQLAHHLRASGVGPEVLVGLCVERSLEMIVGLLGILKAGGVYVPMDPAYPFERLTFMIHDSGIHVLLTQERLLEKLPRQEAPVICLDTDWEMIAHESVENPIHKTRANNLAYVIYTSGSTGQPKGVLIEHRGLCNLALAQKQIFPLHAESRVLQFASLSFDASVWEIFMTLLSGARLFLCSQESLLTGSGLLHHLRDQAITFVTLPPSVLASLPDEELPALRTIVSAGEDCPPDVVARWARNRQFFNAYGPTEATVCATISAPLQEGQKPLIGRPIVNTQVYLLDHHLQPVSTGVEGEIYISGPGLARGYLNRQELTSERFFMHAFDDESQVRLYKTGDRGRYLPDGSIEFLGRVDDQVKLRGFRIELGEIETVLNTHAGVRQAVVVVREEAQGDKRLIAYVVLREQQLTTISNLQGYMAKHVPSYMVPTAFVLLKSLPLTSNGKVDRHALPDPNQRWPELSENFVGPRTAIEETIAGIWSQALGIEQIGIYDDFCALGGDSLMAMRVTSHIHKTLQRDLQKRLPLHRFFEASTIAELSQFIELVEEKDIRPQIPALQPIQRESHRRKLSSLISQ